MPRGSTKDESGLDEAELFSQVLRLRREHKNNIDTQALLDALKATGTFNSKALTLAHVKRAEDRAKRRDAVALERAEQERVAAEAEAAQAAAKSAEQKALLEAENAALLTDPARCRLSGDGLVQAKTREAAEFSIEACDPKGRKRDGGGDAWTIAIRGPAKTRCRVTDNGDGTYTCQWKPWCSGTYSLSISLWGARPRVPARVSCTHRASRRTRLIAAPARTAPFLSLPFVIQSFVRIRPPAGTVLPGSPYTVNAVTNLPCASKCLVRGNGLHNGISRTENKFEVLFKDRLGQIAHAVDLDVFVEPAPLASPRSLDRSPKAAAGAPAAAGMSKREREEKERRAAKDAEDALSAEFRSAGPMPTVMLERRKTSKQTTRGSKESSGSSTSKRDAKVTDAAASAAAAAAATAAAAAAAEAIDEPSFSEAKQTPSDEASTRYRKIRIRVGDRPLLLRADFAKDSEMIGRLMPGRMATVIEERTTPDGREVRACIAIDSVGPGIDTLPTTNTPLPSGRASARDLSTNMTLAAEHLRERLASSPRTRRRSLVLAASFNGLDLNTTLRHELEKIDHGASSRRSRRGEVDERASAEHAAIALTASSDGEGEIGGESRDGSPKPSPKVAGGCCVRQPDTAASTASSARGGGAMNAFAEEVKGTGQQEMGMESARSTSSSVVSSALPLTGWVTLIKDGHKLVTSRVKLGPGSRRQYQAQWARRAANDKRERKRLEKAEKADLNEFGKPSGLNLDQVLAARRYSTEFTADPSGIGFGFGGMEPGSHSHGKLHEVHTVRYSVGLAGHYFLHVRLRQLAMPIPGSPFLLCVEPAAPHGLASRLPPGPIRGKVGFSQGEGCECVLRTADRMGNLCIAGGAAKARLQIASEDKGIESHIADHDDGTYTLRWQCKMSGTFVSRVTIDGVDCIGSPLKIILTSSHPELGKSELTGGGLKGATAGEVASFSIKFVDQFNNPVVPSADYSRFGLAFLKEKEKISAASASHAFETHWEAGETGICELRYTATHAGACSLHVWCDPKTTDEKAEQAKIPFPGSPFILHVAAGKAAASASVVDG